MLCRPPENHYSDQFCGCQDSRPKFKDRLVMNLGLASYARSFANQTHDQDVGKQNRFPYDLALSVYWDSQKQHQRHQGLSEQADYYEIWIQLLTA